MLSGDEVFALSVCVDGGPSDVGATEVWKKITLAGEQTVKLFYFYNRCIHVRQTLILNLKVIIIFWNQLVMFLVSVLIKIIGWLIII